MTLYLSSGINNSMRIKIDKEKLAELYNSGMTMHEIANIFGVSYTTINRSIIKYGIETRGTGRKQLYPKERKCTKCGETKVIELFVKDKKLACGHGYHCKQCHADLQGFRSPVDGFTEEDFNKLLAEQNGLCKICGKKETMINKSGRLSRLSIDHCHENGHVRGLLCGRCNKGLGSFFDNITIMESAIKYIKETSVK